MFSRKTSKAKQGNASRSKSAGAADDNVDDDDEEEEEEEGIGAWGSSKKDFYNADTIETEADALEEEEEAKKLQKKQLKAMKEADFGVDDFDQVADDTKPEDVDGVVTEVLPQLEIPEDMAPGERLKLLKSRYPEFEPLAKDLIDLEPTYKELLAAAEEAQRTITDFTRPPPLAVTKFRALSAYLGSISMYLTLLTSSSENGDEKVVAMPPAELRSHPIMQSLVKCKKLWESVKDQSISEPAESTTIESEGENDEVAESAPTSAGEEKVEKPKAKRSGSKKLTREQRAAQAALAEAEARRAEKIRKAEEELADLPELIKKKPTKTSKKQATEKKKEKDDGSDFGDEDGLTAHEAEEKARKKRSLRFYTSQIAQKTNKRSAAGRDAGGDQDLPYRERIKDRQARLNAEAEKRGRQPATAREQLGNDSGDEEDRRVAAQLRGEKLSSSKNDASSGSDDEDYYDMVAARRQQRKAEKQSRAEAYAEAARQGAQVEEVEEIGPDGKRAITYQIQKNKGLAPKRSKENRNPRVKKRKKFEKKKKRLPSIRPVYKGGEGPGGYGGELTGIKKNLVKSVKL